MDLPKNFRKLTVNQRQDVLSQACDFSQEEINEIISTDSFLEIADSMVEAAVGILPVPLGVAGPFLIDDETYYIPMATEEPSVIAAATHTSGLIKKTGGFTTKYQSSVMTVQIFFENISEEADTLLFSKSSDIANEVNSIIPSMKARGGGFRNITLERLETNNALVIALHIDVCDAFGANVLNTVGERMKPVFSKMLDAQPLMSILTNDASERLAEASFSLPLKYLKDPQFSSEELGRRIVRASQIGQDCPTRAVTHNKGIMNGVSALALATGNDTRAIESAAHFYAQKEGSYKGLTQYTIEDGCLIGRLKMPMPFGSVGGATTVGGAYAVAMRILGNPSGKMLSRIAAALGLAQNFAALKAIVGSGGIQKGHMRLHAVRIAFAAGARGEELRRFAGVLHKENIYDVTAAKKLLNELK